MLTIDDSCSACGTHGPVAALATLGGGRQIALCGACAHRRDAVRAFVAQFDRARRVPTRATPWGRDRAGVSPAA
jgi:hypothetical protein